PIQLARDKGWNVHGETCVQYFFVDYTFLERPGFEGAKYVYTPPPRDKANQDVLWRAVRTDVLSVISRVHCAFLWVGQKTLVGDVETVLLRGNVIVEGGELVGKPGVGQFVRRARFGEELLPAAAATA